MGLLGKGAYATAYLADQLGTDRRAVVKIANRHVLEEDGSDVVRGQFLDEARAATRVVHPNLVTIYTTGETSDGLPAIAMEFVPGDSFDSLLERSAPLSFAQLDCIRQVASALAEVHRNGVVHRDVSPGNVIVTAGFGGFTAKLLDFGIAKVAGSSSRSFGPAGTPRYVAMEQIHGNATTASDVFSLGAVLWWALTGVEYLIEHKTIGAIVTHMSNQTDAPDPRAVNPDVPPSLAQLVQQMLHPDPERRISARQVAEGWPKVLRAAKRWRRHRSIPPDASTMLKVLVVEPDRVAQLQIVEFVKRMGCEVRSTMDPRAATRGAHGVFDVVILSTRLSVSPVAVARHLVEYFPEQTLIIAQHPESAWVDPVTTGAIGSFGIPGQLTQLAELLEKKTKREVTAVSEESALDPAVLAGWSTRRPFLRARILTFLGSMPEWLLDLGEGGDRVADSCAEMERASRELGALHLTRLVHTYRMLHHADELPNRDSFIDEIEREYQRVFTALRDILKGEDP